MRITVVVPSLNQVAYLGACLQSVLGQEQPDLECIVVDGGSTDGSAEIIRKRADRLAWWVSEPDRGHYDAVNKGMARATGEILCWLNSDDMLAPGSLGVVTEVFDRFPDVDWITGVPALWDGTGRMVDVADVAPVYARTHLRRGEHDGVLLHNVQQEGCFWRRGLWEAVGGRIDTRWDLAGDFDLWTRMAEHADLVTVRTVLGGNRQHAEQRTVTRRDLYSQQVELISAARGARAFLRGPFFRRLRAIPGGYSLYRVFFPGRGAVIHWEGAPLFRWVRSQRRVV